MKISTREFRAIVEWFLGIRECPFMWMWMDCMRCHKMMGLKENYSLAAHPCDRLSKREVKRRAAKLLRRNLKGES